MSRDANGRPVKVGDRLRGAHVINMDMEGRVAWVEGGRFMFEGGEHPLNLSGFVKVGEGR